MKQEAFEARYAPLWSEFEAALAARARKGAGEAAEAPRLFRVVCQHLALARDREYGAELVARLDALALRGHAALYGSQGGLAGRIGAFIAGGFAHAVRREWRLVAAAALLFFGPLAAIGFAIQVFPDLVYYLIDARQVAKFEEMYSPTAKRLGRMVTADSSVAMFGFYIWNNVRIGFQTFAGGLVYGLGTVFYLLFNGLYIGATAGHLTHIGHGTPFWSFVSGHSALELTAIVLSGAAGLRLGAALVAPGGMSRRAALVAGARRAALVVYGAALMFLAAAFVEAFWSPLTEIAPPLKYLVGIAMWFAVGAYFILAGRPRAA
jgi:uncharacterized membrane protein SpoIIM required for sporulation